MGMNVMSLEDSFNFPFITTANKIMADSQTFDVVTTLKSSENDVTWTVI